MICMECIKHVSINTPILQVKIGIALSFVNCLFLSDVSKPEVYSFSAFCNPSRSAEAWEIRAEDCRGEIFSRLFPSFPCWEAGAAPGLAHLA